MGHEWLVMKMEMRLIQYLLTVQWIIRRKKHSLEKVVVVVPQELFNYIINK
jgi:hypothetical protein